jgi:hypothetical protein
MPLIAEMAQSGSFDGQIQYVVTSQSTVTCLGIPKSTRNNTFVRATPEVLSSLKLERMMIEANFLLPGLNSVLRHQFLD